ncbi:MAG: hypothetical protein JXB14_06795, partial [Candidatus Altiarchaeota archaeon]|nr:hypothetical protein [Candidatus Altiarchaeota archaeon]
SAEDADGIDEIKLYDDGSLEESYNCRGRTTCTVYFDMYESKPGRHTYTVKVYDELGDYESDTLRVNIRDRMIGGDRDEHGCLVAAGYTWCEPKGRCIRAWEEDCIWPVGDIPRLTGYYSIPSSPQVGQSFQFHVSAYDNDGLYKLELWEGSSRIGLNYCYGTTTCSKTFSVASKNSPGGYTYTVKAYDTRSRSASASKTVYIQSGYIPPYPPYNEPPAIVSSYFSPSQPAEGQSFQIYVRATDDRGLSRIEVWEGGGIRGSQSCNNARDCSATISISGRSSGTYSFTFKAIDNQAQTTTMSGGVVVSPSVVVYTCKQLGGLCCPDGGTNFVWGSRDCPNNCFALCTPQYPSDQTSPPTTPPTQPTPTPYIVLSTDSGSFILFVASVVILVLIIGLGWAVLRR